MDWIESSEAIGKVDELLASVGLGHGNRKTLAGTWKSGERLGKSKIQSKLKTKISRPKSTKPDVVRAPGWEKLSWLRHGFSTCTGGVSSIYGDRSLNLGWTQQDDAANVAEHEEEMADRGAHVKGEGEIK